MSKSIIIAHKELKDYFQSPLAYIVLVIAVTIFNVFFYMIVDQNQEASLRDVFKVMEFLFVFLVPLLTMNVFAEEKQTGTMEFLMTTPTTNTAIVLGKYLGSLVFFTLLLALTGIYYGILEFFASPDRAAILTGYLGIWLEGAFFIAVGVLTSSWTRSPMIAAMTSYVILFFLYFSISFGKYFSGPAEALIRYLGTWSHMQNFAAGLITGADLAYYLSGILFCVTLTRLSMENKLWE